MEKLHTEHVTLSVTKTEQAAAVTCAQDMIYQKYLLEFMGVHGGISYDLGSR